MADVFVSYSKDDRALAQALADDLATNGFDVWWDFQLYAGDDFHDMIRAEIAKAKAVVVIWSDTAVASKWVRGEAEEATDHGTLISTFAPGFDTRRVPINFRALHCEPVINRPRVIASIEQKGAMRRAITQPATDAVSVLRSKASQGDAAAQVDLAILYQYGRSGLPKDECEAARLFKLAAAQGDSYAQTELGVFYEHGLGALSKDEREAARLYKLAVDQGNAYAQTQLGVFYEHGLGGLPKDDHEAARLYKLAADQGHAHGQACLGAFYDQGRGGLPKNDHEAGRLFRLAADQGSAWAQAYLGAFYEEGRGDLPKDDNAATRLYKLSADQGNRYATAALRRLMRDT